MRGRQRIHILLIAGFVTWIAAQSQAQTYSMKALGVGPPTDVYYRYTTPKINNSGQVVGNDRAGGYLYSGGAVTALPHNVLDINNNGAIAMFVGGNSFISFPPYTTQTNMGTLQACLAGDTFATSLNDSGAAVGVANAPTSCPQPFFSFNGQITSLGPTQPEARWMAINNSNQIVGYSQDYTTPPYSIRAVELINGTLTDLDPSNATAYDSEAVAINNAGEFVVNSNEAFCTKKLGPPSFKTITYACRGANWYPVLYSGSTVTTLPVLGPYGGTAAAIDYWGDVVGTSQTSTGATHGFVNLYGATFDLNSHPLTNGTGWTILQAYDINDNGQIVALGANSSGAQDVVVLTPQPVKQPPPASVRLNRSILMGGIAGTNSSIGTVTLSGPAPPGGTIVFLRSSNGIARVPNKIRVKPGSLKATFTVTTSRLSETVAVTIMARTGSSTQMTTLTVVGNGL